MKASIITIGDEILIGQIVDTNAVSISKHLNGAGIVVAERATIGDDRGQITATLQRAMDNSQVVIITGGLGPTKDDITKDTLAEIFGGEMKLDREVAHHVQTLLEGRGIPFTELNREQAMVPESCAVIFNMHGTAPGMWFERGGCVVVSLPGVPYEMEHLMEDEVIPRLKARFAPKQIVHRTLITAAIAESILAERIEEWESALPEYIKLAYLPNPGGVRLRLSAYDVEGSVVEEQIAALFDTLKEIIPEFVVGYETATIQEFIHNLLIERGESLAVAESCTGGAIASKITSISGASAYFKCGVVSYSNESKVDLLGVGSSSIDEFGAVSESVAREMAEGVRRVACSDYGIATTGVAGPTGGTPEKPIGMVWFALATQTRTIAVCQQCGLDRGQIVEKASAFALLMLRDELLSK